MNAQPLIRKGKEMITKGNWEFNGRDVVVGQNIGQQRICTIIEHREEFKKEDEANARLITAAPKTAEQRDKLLDMLDACVDSQECNGYIGVQTMKEAKELLNELN